MFKTARQLIELKNLKKETERSLNLIKIQIEEIEEKLQAFFVDNGLKSMVIDGQNLILTEKKLANSDQSFELVEWLRENGHEQVFSKPINPISFTSLFNKELTDEEKNEIGDMVTIESKFTFQMRKK